MPPVSIRNATSLACHQHSCQPQKLTDASATSFDNYQSYMKVLIVLMGLRNLALVIIVQFTNTFFDKQCHFFFETKDLTSASGPIKVRLAAENQPHATFEVSVCPLSNVPGTDAKLLPYTMHSLLSSLSCSLKTHRRFFSSSYNHSLRHPLLHFSLHSSQP